MLKTPDNSIDLLYEDTVRKLESKIGLKAGLERMLSVDNALGNPSRSFPSIHVGGTNGKGSVSTKIAYGLSQRGRKVGLFTSPHIDTCRERIQINGQMIPSGEFVESFNAVVAISEDLMFFEIVTLMAFLYFRKHKVDIAVFEVGLGGALDATNIILPELSVITNVTMDHMQYLGNTIESIATNKAGIIKPGVPVVLGNRAVFPCVLKQAFACKSPIYFAKGDLDWMEENTLIAKRALSVLTSSEPCEDLSIVQPCRFETIDIDGFTVVFDVAHNIDGLTQLFARLKSQFQNQKFAVVVGMARDKEHGPCVRFIKSQTDMIYPISREHSRLLTQSEIEEVFGIANTISLASFAENAEKENRVLVVCGSFFIMKEMKEVLTLCRV